MTPYVKFHPELFRLGSFVFTENERDYRLTVDTPEDLQLISMIIKRLYPVKPDFSIHDILVLLKENPEWKEINSHVKQKVVGG